MFGYTFHTTSRELEEASGVVKRQMIKGMIKVLLYIMGFSLVAFAVIYAIALIAVDLLAENSVKVALVGIAAVILLLIARRMSEKHG